MACRMLSALGSIASGDHCGRIDSPHLVGRASGGRTHCARCRQEFPLGTQCTFGWSRAARCSNHIDEPRVVVPHCRPAHQVSSPSSSPPVSALVRDHRPSVTAQGRKLHSPSRLKHRKGATLLVISYHDEWTSASVDAMPLGITRDPSHNAQVAQKVVSVPDACSAATRSWRLQA
jgi:hypothetical protein